MILIRPVVSKDLEPLYEMAQQAGIGVTTLPVNKALLVQRIDESQRAFGGSIPAHQAYYLFVLEDTEKQRIFGVSGIKARVGLDEVWYNYRVSTTVNASKELGLHIQTPTLYLTNDMTNCTEICTLFLDKSYRQGLNGQLLSKCRFMFLAEFADKFSARVFAEMRGYADEQGNSPFWNSLGKKFFGLEFSNADYLTGTGHKEFVAELMPRYPIFIPFLEAPGQQVIAKVHPHTEPALAMLERERFHYNGMVDIFDAGPLVEAFVTDIRAVSDSQIYRTRLVDHGGQSEAEPGATPVMVANRLFADFRALLVSADQVSLEHIAMTQKMHAHMKLSPGESVRAVALRAPATTQSVS
jgi:arginine N-succinyltransferase